MQKRGSAKALVTTEGFENTQGAFQRSRPARAHTVREPCAQKRHLRGRSGRAHLCFAGTLNDIAVREFHDALSRDDDMAFAVAAICALTAVIKRSTAATLMGVSKELEDAAQALQRCGRSAKGRATA